VTLPSVLARLESVADNSILIDSRQPCCLPDATTVLQVLENSECLVMGQPATEQGGTFAFREAALTGAAGKHPTELNDLALA
jgi:hypothetical protein